MKPLPLKKLADDTSGLALIEFALSLPIVLSMGLGGLELANYAIATERVSQIAMTAADNAARVRTAIDEVDVNEVMAGAKFVGESIDFSKNGRIILSSLEENAAKNGQWIRWQRCAGAKTVNSSFGVQGDGKTDSSLQGMGPTGKKIAAVSDTAVMFVEVFYDYQPIVPMPMLGYSGKTMNFTAAFNVRERTDQVLYNAKNLTGSNFSNCGLYVA
ncbi:MAG: TadE/TadG family type IV pilus assembly protein [Sphingomonadaceae bacterium]